MIRLRFAILSIAFAVLLQACEQGGPAETKAILVPKSIASLISRLPEKDYAPNLAIAVDPSRNRYGLADCRNPLPGCAEHVSTIALENCKKGLEFDCQIMFEQDRLTWSGPILVEHWSSGQILPVWGEWRITLKNADTERHGTLRVQRARMIAVFGNATPCPLSVTPKSFGGGRLELNCGDIVLRGNYRVMPNRVLRAEDGDKSVRIDLAKGRGL